MAELVYVEGEGWYGDHQDEGFFGPRDTEMEAFNLMASIFYCRGCANVFGYPKRGEKYCNHCNRQMVGMCDDYDDDTGVG